MESPAVATAVDRQNLYNHRGKIEKAKSHAQHEQH
jgi:hypothetical protein